MNDGKPKLLGQLRQQIRFRSYSIRTKAVYADWAKTLYPLLSLSASG
jgi:hypothetical protein